MSEKPFRISSSVPRAHAARSAGRGARARLGEIYGELRDTAQRGEQAARCIDCGNPYCEWECPRAQLHSGMAQARARRPHHRSGDADARDQSAARDLRTHLSAGSFVRRRCTLNDGFDAVTIGAIEQWTSRRGVRAAAGGRSVERRTDRKACRRSSAPDRPDLSAADRLVRAGIGAVRVRPLRGNRRPADVRHPAVQARQGRRAQAPRECSKAMGVEVPSRRRNRHAMSRSTRCSMTTTRCSSAPARTATSTADCRARTLPGVLPALPFLIANVRRMLGDGNATAHARSGRQARRRARRRRHGDGLRAHRDPLDAASVTLRLPPRRSEHAGLAPRSEERRDEGVQFLFNRQPLADRRRRQGRQACA